MFRMNYFSAVELRCLDRSLSALNDCTLTPLESQVVEKLKNEIAIELKWRE